MNLMDAIQFLPSVPDSSLLYASSYSPVLVTFSILMAIISSYAALSMAPRVMQATRAWERLVWILVGAFALGSGVWAMHFIGMLALNLPCNVYYEPTATILSMIPSALASGVALSVLSTRSVAPRTLIVGSLLLGAGIGVMHYSGMAAMRLQGFVRYDPKLFALSILVAVVLAFVALHIRERLKTFGWGRDILAAVIMGGAISGMHYTAMSASYFVRGNVAAVSYPGFNHTYLLMATVIVSVVLTAMAIVATIEHRNLETREENWRFALEGAGHGVWEWNVQTGEMQLSRGWREMVGAVAEADGRTSLDEFIKYIHPEDMPSVYADMQAYFDGKTTAYASEHRVQSKDGSWRWVLSRGVIVSRDAGGKPLRLTGTHTDITERKQAESATRLQQEQLQLILDSTAEAIYGIDLEGNCTFCNSSCLNLLGYKQADELLGQNVHWLIHYKRADGTALPVEECRIYRAFRQGQPTHVDDEVLWRADGSCFPAEYWSHPQFRDGAIIGAAVTFMDITERKRAEDREQARNHVLELLAKGAPLSTVLQSITLSVERQNEDMRCSILLLDADGRHLLIGAAPNMPDFYAAAIQGMEIGRGMGSCAASAFTGERIIVEDIQTHPDCAPFKELAASASLGSCWSEPIKDAAGKVLGTLGIYRSRTGVPKVSDIQLIEQVSNLAGVAINQSRINEERQLALLVYQNSSEAMMVTNADGAIIAINPAFTELTGYTLDEVIGKNPNILSSGRQNKTFYQAMWDTINTTGRWQGEIWNRRKNGEIYAEWMTINSTFNQDGTVHSRAALFTDITQRKESEELIWQQANFDSLTGLPNRHMLRSRLEQDIKKSHRANLPLALLFLDLDHFKEINDTLGHDMGDLLLKEAAQRLSGCIRETDCAARLGGDEFTIILTALSDHGSVERVAEDILQKLAAPFHLGGETAYVSASIGITMYPEDATSAEALLKNADQAMYMSKSLGRNRYSYFTPAMQEAAQKRMQLANNLRGALDNQQFRLVYQPIVELATGTIHKAEALIRWQHPTLGLISPVEFIPIAEETGIIVQIGDWVFYEVAGQVKRLRASCDSEFQISINKSPTQFYNEGNSHTSWISYMKKLGLPGQAIVVEITESLLLDTSSNVSRQLLEFRDAGIEVSLDDFGTGYSALSYLKQFHIDYLKIDQSFVRNLAPDSSDMALCEAIIVMAHKLGIKVIAEGVETAEQRDLLIAAGCDYGQGFLLSRPVPVEELELLLAEQSAIQKAIGSGSVPATMYDDG